MKEDGERANSRRNFFLLLALIVISNAVRSKKANPKVAGIWILLILTYSWMIVWIMGVFLTTYYELYTLTQWKTLTTILWVPALPLACWLAVDFAMQARKYSFGYLVAYLWLIEIIPYIAGSYIALGICRSYFFFES